MTRLFLALNIVVLQAAPNYGRHVAPILDRHCVPCHRAGHVAPFALDTYASARAHARTIAAVTARRYMPPWKASHLVGAELAGERRLTAVEIATLNSWAMTGTLEGAPVPATKAPEASTEWALGQPDLVLEMPEPFAVAAVGQDVYQCFVIPTSLPASRWVKSFEFAPGSRRAVHHALFFLDSSGRARERDAAEPGPGYRCFGLPGFLPTASLGGWSPGNGAYEMPAGTALPLRKSADLVLQVHYHVTGTGIGTAALDRSRLALYFSSTPPTKSLFDVALASRQIDIAPGDRASRVRDAITLPVAVDLLGVIPHAHYLARQMRAWAILPTGRRQNLFEVLDWDFNWQQNYRYVRPIRLPADTRLEMEFVYDNSSQNPRNPSRPPQRVGWGPETTDEMAGLHFQVIPANPADAAELAQTLWGKLIRFIGAGGLRHTGTQTGTQNEAAPPPQP